MSERDYIAKIALLGRKSKDTLVKEISTKTSNLMTAHPQDSVDECMEKMLSKDIRHLPLLDENGKVIGMLSVSIIVFKNRVFSALALNADLTGYFSFCIGIIGKGSCQDFGD